MLIICRLISITDIATILIVDNLENVRYLLSYTLSDSYQVIEASNGQEGLEAAKQHQPELIITDVQMPIMCGLAMIKAIRASNQEIKIIACGTFFPGKEKELITAGANCCLSKPFDIEVLRRTIKELIG